MIRATFIALCFVSTLNVQAQDQVSFELEIQPILAAGGCSTGACHGKQRGQNGFQLSLLGYDSNFDYDQIVLGGKGRRVFPASPRDSLLLLKATAALPHGGGRKIQVGSPSYGKLLSWIQAGMPRRVIDEPTLDRVTVSPRERFMKPNESLRLIVTAHYSDETQRDVTEMSMFQSNESALVAVDETGTVTAGPLPGEASIMARYMNVISTCNVAIPLADKVPSDFYANLPINNFIDVHVYNKLQSLNLTPSEQVGDAKFMRRVFVDIIGTIPSATESADFIESTDPNKRSKLIDALLDRPEYADHWATKWADLLRPNPYRAGIKAVMNYDNWIRDQFRQNRPWNDTVHDLLTARGSTYHNGSVTLFRDRRSPDELTTITSQLFLGIRLECAKCHHHPFEKWSQGDFYRFAAYFARVGRKGRGVSPPISGDEEMVYVSSKGSVTHPKSGEVLEPAPLFGSADEPKAYGDFRKPLADWITSPDNEYFARVMVNRIWADLMGRGIVDPVDDLRATNPPSNEPLLSALAEKFVQSGFNIKDVIRQISSSAVYSTASDPNDRNAGDTRNFSRRYRTRLRAETLYDSVTLVTGHSSELPALPKGGQAKQFWTHRIGSSFLDTFGRPDPNQDPPCERQEQTTVTQTLHLMNSRHMHDKVTSNAGTAATLAASNRKPSDIVGQLYLSIFNRFPTDKEQSFAVGLYTSNEPSVRRTVTEDLMWALLNTPEFMFKD